MSEWLRPLDIQRAFTIAAAESQQDANSVPDWVGLLIWSGWWMNGRTLSNDRTVMVLLLPTRICCPAFCCLGTLIRSIQRGDTALSWNQFLELPEGSRVCLRYPDPKLRHRKIPVKGIIGKTVLGSKAARQVRIVSENRRFNGLTQSVLQCRFDDYEITSAPPLPARLDKRLSRAMLFYKYIIEGFKPTSILAWSKECLLVTNLAAWKNEVESPIVSVQEGSGRHSSYALQELLMWSHDFNAEYSGVFVSSPKSATISSINSPVAILNGPDAIRSWDRIRSPNIIILIDNMEYDDSVENFLALLSDARSDKAIALPDAVPENPPSGVEMVIFNLA